MFLVFTVLSNYRPSGGGTVRGAQHRIQQEDVHSVGGQEQGTSWEPGGRREGSSSRRIVRGRDQSGESPGGEEQGSTREVINVQRKHALLPYPADPIYH